MKKFPILILSVCSLLGALGLAYVIITETSNAQRDFLTNYSCGRVPNARKTGELIFVGVLGIDQFSMFVSDKKRPESEAVQFGELRYSSTQGSDSIFFSKDRMMFAEYSEATERFEHRSPWVGGYDWKTHQTLDSSQIARAFDSHGGKGEDSYPTNFKAVTPQEIEQFHLTDTTP